MDIRTIEREVVDQYHRSMAVWRWPQSAIIWGVLRHLGQVYRDFGSPDMPDVSLIDLWRVSASFRRGAAQAVRWAVESEAIEYDWLPENERVLDETMELLSWGVDYARLSACFIAWTRKAIDAEIDEARHRVRFTFDSDVGTSLTAADLKENERSLAAFAPPVHTVRDLLALDAEEDWRAAGQWPSERPKLTGHPAFAAAAKWAHEVLVPELEGVVSIGTFGLSDLRRFWASVWLVSACYAIHEDDVDRRTNHKNDLPAAVLCMTRDQWIDKLAAAVGLGKERIAMLLDLLTFDHETLHSSIASHPFVAASSGLVFLCPRLVYHCEPRGILSWVLNARPELRGAYGTLNQRLQRYWIEKLGHAFRTAGWTCWTEHRFRSDGAEIAPDIVAQDRNCEVLVVDFKHTTAPIEPRQICDRLNAFDTACCQVRRYRTVLRNHPEMLASVGIGDCSEVPRVALIYRWPLAIPYGKVSEVAVLHVERVLHDLRNGARTVAQLLASPAAESLARVASEEIRVAEWTFETPGIELG